ncbi:hypothetical protein ACFU96_48045 [Streptomyces sp. NPDC057620]|uniref:hypothetical protein n=1 Tax=Streptomyces sp. NPDC057620 TaxID=3346185 RepID=UPI0036AB7AFF
MGEQQPPQDIERLGCSALSGVRHIVPAPDTGWAEISVGPAVRSYVQGELQGGADEMFLCLWRVRRAGRQIRQQCPRPSGQDVEGLGTAARIRRIASHFPGRFPCGCQQLAGLAVEFVGRWGRRPGLLRAVVRVHGGPLTGVWAGPAMCRRTW